MANFTTTNDLKLAALKRAGELTDGNSDFDADALEYINEGQRFIVAGGNEYNLDLYEPWTWARERTTLELVPDFEGTTAVTKGSTTLTFSAAPTPASLSLAGRFIKLAERNTFYRIATHVANTTAATLDANYVEDTEAAIDYRAIKLEYDFPVANVARLVDPAVVYFTQPSGGDGEFKIYSMDLSNLTKDFPLRELKERGPIRYAEYDNDDGQIRLRFSDSVSTEQRVEFEYIPYPTALTFVGPDATPIIPQEHRRVLEYIAAYWIQRDKEDSLSQDTLRFIQNKLQSMLLENRRRTRQTGKDKGRLSPRDDARLIPVTRLDRFF